MTTWPQTRRPITGRQKVHQRRRLRALLALGSWTLESAAEIIAGTDPDRTMRGPPACVGKGVLYTRVPKTSGLVNIGRTDPGPRHGYISWGWLPGGHRPDWPENGEELDVAVNTEIDRVRGILSCIETYPHQLGSKPEDWLNYFLAHATEPPRWLIVAVADKRGVLFRKSSITLSRERSEAGRRGGLATKSRNPNHSANVLIREDILQSSRNRTGELPTAYAMARRSEAKGDTAEFKTIEKWFRKQIFAMSL